MSFGDLLCRLREHFNGRCVNLSNARESCDRGDPKGAQAESSAALIVPWEREHHCVLGIDSQSCAQAGQDKDLMREITFL